MAIRLNLACGVNLRDGWVNVDLLREGVEVERVDLTKPWPWADESVDEVYCEHFLEHLEPTEARFFMEEAYRVLAHDGILSIGVPDCGLIMLEYVEGKNLHEYIPKRLWSVPTMDQIQWWFRQNGNHKWGYDERSLGSLFKRHGFTCSVREWQEGRDSRVRKYETLYMDGVKP